MGFEIDDTKILTASAVATIPNGLAESNGIDLKGGTVVSVRFPDALTGTSISFLSADNLTGTYIPLNDETGALVSITFAADTEVGLPPEIITRLLGVRFIKLKSDSAEAAERVMTIKPRQF